MPEHSVTSFPNIVESVARSNSFAAPLANTVFFTIPASDLPAGYYQFDTITGLTMVSGAQPNITDMRNFLIQIGARPAFVAQTIPDVRNLTTGWIFLTGNENIVCKVGATNATVNSFYAMSVFLTKRSN